MKNEAYCLLFALFFLEGCFDIFKEQEEHIVGNISLLNSETRENDGYRMVISTNDHYVTLLDANYVVDVIGNDTMLVVKCIHFTKCIELYYKVDHKNGLEPTTVSRIKQETYTELIKSINSKYSFHGKPPACP